MWWGTEPRECVRQGWPTPFNCEWIVKEEEEEEDKFIMINNHKNVILYNHLQFLIGRLV